MSRLSLQGCKHVVSSLKMKQQQSRSERTGLVAEEAGLTLTSAGELVSRLLHRSTSYSHRSHQTHQTEGQTRRSVSASHTDQ